MFAVPHMSHCWPESNKVFVLFCLFCSILAHYEQWWWNLACEYLPRRHMTLKWRRTDVDATYWRRSDVSTTPFRCHVFAGCRLDSRHTYLRWMGTLSCNFQGKQLPGQATLQFSSQQGSALFALRVDGLIFKGTKQKVSKVVFRLKWQENIQM